MLTLNDGRNELWQWDTGRKLTVDAECSQVHFSNKVFGRSVDVDVVDGIAIIPDILLQTDKELTAWAFVGTAENGYTKISMVFKVNKRNKPADYVFTPPEQTALQELVERLAAIEESQDPDAIKNAVEDYLEQNPVDVPVESVNGKTGAVKLTAEDVGAISQDDLQEATNDALAQAKESGEFDGRDGKNGTSATHSWNGTVLTVTSASGTSSADLKGATGNPGKDGSDGKDGADGYTPVKGKDYFDGKSAYQYAKDGGYTGTEEEFSEKLAKEYPTKVSELANDAGYLTGYTETDPTVPSWAKTETKPSYTKSEVGLGNVENVKQYSANNPPPYPVKSVNGKTGAVSLSASDVGAMPSNTAIPSKTSQLTNDSKFATEDFVTSKIAEAELGGEEVDLSGYAKKSELPTKTSQLTNDSGYLTAVPDGYAKTEDIPKNPSDIGAQPAGNYALKSEIPTKVSQLQNDSGYLTEHQDISGKLDASALPTAINTALAEAKASGEFDGATGKTAYQYAQDGGYTGTEVEFAEKLAGGASASALQTFIDNTDVDYAYDAETGVNYTVIRVYRDKVDGTKQFPFVHHEQRKSTYDLVMEHGFCLAINAGVFNTTTGAADGIVIENGEVLQDGETTTHPQCLPLTIDANGNLSYASYNASAVELAANGIVSAVTGFMPIIIDYQEYAQANWNSVAHYTENAQRQIIGQFGNGDYAIVTCEGRSHQNSDGWTIAEAQTVCKRLGLKFAYNLDGGGSTETMFGYKHLNTIYDGTTGRKVPTFIVFTGSTSIDVTPGEVPETYTEVEYVETSGDAYIRTDITEAATPFDYEAKILSTIDQSNITTENNGNGHLFSATNTWYPFFKLKESSGEVIRRINGTENSSGGYASFVANKWYVLSSTQSDGSNITTFFDVAANKSLYTSTKVNGETYDTSKTFCICAYGADSGQKRLRFFGKLSYIKLSMGGELVHHFVAAKSNKTGVYGLLDKVTGVFYRSTSGTEFTGA